VNYLFIPPMAVIPENKKALNWLFKKETFER
jgi:hypothetical protein